MQKKAARLAAKQAWRWEAEYSSGLHLTGETTVLQLCTEAVRLSLQLGLPDDALHCGDCVYFSATWELIGSKVLQCCAHCLIGNERNCSSGSGLCEGLRELGLCHFVSLI